MQIYKLFLVLIEIFNVNTVVFIRLTAFVKAFTGFSIALNDSKSLLQK
jgi:hypothetical protein